MKSPVPIMVMIYRRCQVVKVLVDPKRQGTGWIYDETITTLPDDYLACEPGDLIAGVSRVVSRQINDWYPELKGSDVAIQSFIADDSEDVPKIAYEGIPQA
jgi:hypothetical protein